MTNEEILHADIITTVCLYLTTELLFYERSSLSGSWFYILFFFVSVYLWLSYRF